MPVWLAGSRTYLVAIAGALVTVVYMLGWMERDTWMGVMAFLVSGGLATQRAAVAKVEAQVEHVQTVALVQAAAVDAKLSRVEQKVAQASPVVVIDAPPAAAWGAGPQRPMLRNDP